MAHTIVLETDRLILRHFTEDDFDDLAAIYGDPRVTRFIGKGTPKSREEVGHILRCALIDNARAWSPELLQRLPQLARAIERDAHFSLWATIYKPDNRLIGRCGLLSWDLDGSKEVEVGYILAADYWGRGLATEDACASRDYGLNQLGFNRLISVIQPGNIASQRVAVKNGMSREKETTVQNVPVHVYSMARPPA
jgi:ribosomal-protein-alanine N-acetyltransferase